MKYRIIPYVLMGDSWTLSDEQVLSIFRKMERLRLIDKVFIMGEANTPQKFIGLMKNKNNVACVVVDESGNIVTLGWLNNWGFNHAFVHHCFFPEVWGNESVVIGKMVLRYWFSMMNDNNVPILDVIMGKTPENNRLAVRFLKRMGFSIIGTIPDISYDIKASKKIGAIISYIHRESVL